MIDEHEVLELSSAAARLLEAERPIPPADPALAADLLARVEASLGLPPGGGTGGGAGPSGAMPGPPAAVATAGAATSTTSRLASARAFLAGVTFAAGIAVGAAGHALLVEPEVRVVEVPAPGPAHAPAGVEVPAASEPAPPSPRPETARSPRARSAPADQGQARLERAPAGVDDGQALLERARTALQRGDPDEALTALADHRRAHAKSPLAEEREALRVLALVVAGSTEAADAAARFRRRFPGSLFLPAIEQATAGAAR